MSTRKALGAQFLFSVLIWGVIIWATAKYVVPIVKGVLS